jgi:hypothetical protein
MQYEIWLHARDPKTLELTATLRVFIHPDKIASEKALGNIEALFEEGHPQLPFGSVVSAHLLELPNSSTLTILGRKNGKSETALREAACFGDRAAEDYLAKHGSYDLFDNPHRVQAAREALALIGVAS